MKYYEAFKTTNVYKEYVETLINGLQHSFPYLDKNELTTAIDASIKNRLYNGPAAIDNNYEKKRINGTVLDVIKYIESVKPIVTSSGVLYKHKKNAINPLDKVINSFLELRGGYKKEMFKYPKGSEMFEKYNLMQILEKRNANATYGVLGAPTSMLYNIYVAESITRQGRSYISCAIVLFESLLSNNIKFNNLDEVITFISNVQSEKDTRNFDDNLILDRSITREECFYKLLNTADPTIWIPTEKEMMLIWEFLEGVTNEDLNRIYYKNQLYNFCDLPIVSDLIIKILKESNVPFMNPNKPPKNIKSDLDLLTSLIKEYVYYPHFYIDKLDRIEYMQRDIVCVSDTDSTIISFDAWYRYVLDKVYNIDMPIKHWKFDMVELIKADEFGDYPGRVMCEEIEPEYDYNFFTDEVIEMKKAITPTEVDQEESLLYSIINIIAYVCSDLVVDYLSEYTKLTGSYEEGRTCKMIMKNEFFFLRLLLTTSRRNYADLQALQEGNIIPKDKRMAIMGLPINKTTLSDSIKCELQHILLEDILKADKIDQVKIMKKLAIIEKEIYANIMDKKTDYYTPMNVGAMSNYKEPLSESGIISSMFYNEMRTDNMPALNLNERNKIIKIKLDLSKKNVGKIKDIYPEEYNKLITLLNHPTLGSKLNAIGLPVDVLVPDWVLQFVDIQQITADALKNFPLESIGLKRLGNDSANYTNIISL